MKEEKIGFIGLGNLGRNLANSILFGGYKLFVHDLKIKNADKLLKLGAQWCPDIKTLIKESSIIITCLPNAKVISKVFEKSNGILKYINNNHLIIECSTTDEEEVIRLSKLIKNKGAEYLEAPLSGGEHRSVTGNIAVLAAGKRTNFDRAMPILSEIGYEIVYLGDKIGSASTIKVLTNYLASINLLSIGEVFMICKKYGLDLKSVYEAIRVSSGNSFVNTTEGQLILSGSMDAHFTMDLICKDLMLVKKLQEKYNIPSDLIPIVLNIFNDGKKNLGEKSFSTSIIKLLENKCNNKLRADGFPLELKDNEPRKKGIEVKY